MDIRPALELLQRLATALRDELAEASNERALLRTFRSDELLDRATRRERFNLTARDLRDRLTTCVSDAGRGASFEALSERHPELRVAAEIVERLARDLARIDATNLALARRSLSFVHGYLHAVQPPAYGRRGEPASTSVRSTVSTRV